jgi:hypothetical protein
MEHSFVVRIKTSELAKAENSTEDDVLDSVTHAITESLEFMKNYWYLDDVVCEDKNGKKVSENFGEIN